MSKIFGILAKSELNDIAHQNVAYVEVTGNDTTGELNKIGKPFSTINAALDALPLTGGVIKIGIGVFAPIDKNKVKPYVSFIGSKIPRVNSDYTGLIDGTIIKAPFKILDKHHVKVKNLGVDGGLNVCNELGYADGCDGLAIALCDAGGPYLDKPLIEGIEVDGVVTILKNQNVFFHACLIESVKGAYVNNVKTYWGLHGVVFKTVESNINNIWGYGSQNNAIIIKASEGYFAPCHDSNYNNLFARQINGIGAGIYIYSNANSKMERNNFSNLSAIGTSYSIKIEAENGSDLAHCNFANLITDDCPSDGIQFIGRVASNNFANVKITKPFLHGIEFSAESFSNRFENVEIYGYDGTHSNAKYIVFKGKNNVVSGINASGFVGGTCEIDGSSGINYLNNLVLEYDDYPVLVGDKFGLIINNEISCNVYHDTNQSIPSGTPTAMQFNNEFWDVYRMHDTSIDSTKIFCRMAGKYLVTGHINYVANANGYRYLIIRKNNVDLDYCPPVTANANTTVSTALTISYVVDMLPGDYIELYALQGSGGNLQVDKATVSVVKVGTLFA